MKKKSLLLRLVLFVTAMMCALGASAEADVCDFSEDGIFYKIQSGGTTVHVWYEDGSSWDPCYTVDDYNIPETVTHGGTTYTVTGIGHTAFFGCTAVTHISLPKTLTMIGEQAFAGCTSLNSVYCHAMTPPTLKSNAFDATSYNNVLLYVPALVTSAYASADNWSRFQNLNSLRYHFESNGLYYNISGSNTVSVVRKDDYYNSEAYKGSINIPASVTNGGTTYNVTNISSQAFYRCWDLTEVNIGDNVTSIGSYAFQQCTSLTWVSIPATVTSIGVYAFTNCTSLTTIICWATTPPSISTAFNGLFDQATLYVPASAVSTYKATTTWKNFSNIKPIESSETEAYANYTSSNTMLTFYYDNQRSSRSGTTYDLNTGSNDTGWDTDGTRSYVTKVVFDPSFANARPTTTYDWFYGMTNLQSITGLSYLNTSEVTNMAWMFAYCSNLTSLDVSHFNTSKVTDMSGMFFCCTGLTSLDLSSFNTSKVTYMNKMFEGSTNLRTIYVGNGWSTAAVTSSTNMFYNCTRLVGGQGTTYDANHIDKAYAHIDGGPSNPGYFTEKGPEAYACYTPSNTTLTFYYDNLRSSRTGTTYDLNTLNNSPGWYTDGTNANVTKVVFDPSFANARPTTTYGWFDSMYRLQSIVGMHNYLNTSEVTNMDYMFCYCNNDNLTSLDLSHFNTSKVTKMGWMFYSCSNLRTIYVGSGWSTAAVTNSNSMFWNCTSLVGGQGTTYNESNPWDKTYAHIDGGPSNPGYFSEKGPEAYACYTSSNKTLTFYYDSQRSSRTGTTYDLNTGTTDVAWDTDGTNASVTKVVFDPSFAGARPTTTYDWFYSMTNLQSITGMSYLNTSEVTNMGFMFTACAHLTSLDLSSFNTSKVTKMNAMFSGCYNLRTVYVGNGWSTASVAYSDYMFSNCTSLVGGQGTTWSSSNPRDKTYAHIDGGTSNPGYFTDKNAPVAYACYTSSNTTLTFYYDNQRSSRTGTTYDLNTGGNETGWELDGTNASVTKVVFDPSFANARPTTTSRWFYIMQNLESITGMEYLNTSEVTNMAYMFYFCIKLTSLDVSHFNTSKVTDMGAMFRNCSSLTSLDLSSFNTSKVTNMLQMFYYCSSLTNLDLSSFNTSKVTDMRYMFYGSSNLRTIYVGSGWNTTTVTTSDYMFYNCTSLVGGQGTTYDANHTDKTYAHIDGGPSNPGYFTAKNAALRGDVNGDGQVKIDDVTALINLLLSGNTSAPAADCNLDGKVAIGDVTALINYLLSSQW